MFIRWRSLQRLLFGRATSLCAARSLVADARAHGAVLARTRLEHLHRRAGGHLAQLVALQLGLGTRDERPGGVRLGGAVDLGSNSIKFADSDDDD